MEEEKIKEQEVQQEVEKKEPEITEEKRKVWMEFLKRRRENLLRVAASKRVKSINRAIKRNRVTPQGELAPKRPFNNRANTSTRKGVMSRVGNERNKRLYDAFKRFANKESVQ